MRARAVWPHVQKALPRLDNKGQPHPQRTRFTIADPVRLDVTGCAWTQRRSPLLGHLEPEYAVRRFADAVDGCPWPRSVSGRTRKRALLHAGEPAGLWARGALRGLRPSGDHIRSRARAQPASASETKDPGSGTDQRRRARSHSCDSKRPDRVTHPERFAQRISEGNRVSDSPPCNTPGEIRAANL
jgi:hypothetical protein